MTSCLETVNRVLTEQGSCIPYSNKQAPNTLMGLVRLRAIVFCNGRRCLFVQPVQQVLQVQVLQVGPSGIFGCFLRVYSPARVPCNDGVMWVACNQPRPPV